MSKAFYPILLIVVLFSMSAQALRCNSQLVDQGDHISSVIDVCGDPVYEDSSTAYVGDSGVVEDDAQRLLASREVVREVSVRHLVYDFGSRRFKRKLRFIDGHLDRIEKLGRGTDR
ncbi:DUF2845 domain-containing protein [bacterium]|nr:DUF2845 domain-containing protein [bacterium]